MAEPTTNSISLQDLLQYIRRNNESGCLTFLQDGQTIAEIYFVQGHVVHARNDHNTGDDVVYQLINNRSARLKFNRNVAPPEETISRIDELLLLGALGLLTDADLQKGADSEAEKDTPPVPAAYAPTHPVPPAESVAQPAPPIAVMPEVTVAATPTSNGTTSPNGVAHAAESDVNPPITADEPETSGRSSGGAAPRPTLGSRLILSDEVIKPPRFRRWTGLPLPFVSAYAIEISDTDRVVKGVFDLLWQEKFSGFLSSTIEGSEAVSLFYQGRVIHSRFADGRSVVKDRAALQRIISQTVPRSVSTGLLVYPLEAEFVLAYAALLFGEKLLDSFNSQAMKINKLLNTLEHSRHTGVVRVSNEQENGFIFLSAGQKIATYYEVEDVLEESIVRVYQIVNRPDSVIDVLTSPQINSLFETVNRPKSAAEVKQEIINSANTMLGRRATRVISIIEQSEDDVASLKAYCNQARRVAQTFIDKNLADQFYEKALFLLQELDPK